MRRTKRKRDSIQISICRGIQTDEPSKWPWRDCGNPRKNIRAGFGRVGTACQPRSDSFPVLLSNIDFGTHFPAGLRVRTLSEPERVPMRIVPRQSPSRARETSSIQLSHLAIFILQKSRAPKKAHVIRIGSRSTIIAGERSSKRPILLKYKTPVVERIDQVQAGSQAHGFKAQANASLKRFQFLLRKNLVYHVPRPGQVLIRRARSKLTNASSKRFSFANAMPRLVKNHGLAGRSLIARSMSSKALAGIVCLRFDHARRCKAVALLGVLRQDLA